MDNFGNRNNGRLADPHSPAKSCRLHCRGNKFALRVFSALLNMSGRKDSPEQDFSGSVTSRAGAATCTIAGQKAMRRRKDRARCAVAPKPATRPMKPLRHDVADHRAGLSNIWKACSGQTAIRRMPARARSGYGKPSHDASRPTASGHLAWHCRRS
jgi:hypothetical protein